jgi:thiol-disulfide isomerase/thioredoxin
MHFKKFTMSLMFITGLTLSACAGTSAPVGITEPTPQVDKAAMAAETMAEQNTSGEAMPEESGEAAMADKEAADAAMSGSETAGEAMMDEEASGEAMMDKEASGEAMMDKEASGEAMMDEEASGEAMMDEKASGEAMMDEETSTEVMADKTMAEGEEAETGMVKEEMPADEMMAVPAWFEAELTDVNTGSTFKVTDFEDKVVLVETMAVWCPLCLQQQKQVQALLESLGDRDDFVSLALDIDPNEDAAFLQAHTDKNGFDWLYAVAPADVSREIGQLYGGQFLNPSSTPMLIIDRHGQVHPLPFGVKDAQTLQTALAPFLNEG